MFRYIHKALPLNFKEYLTFSNEIHNRNTRTKETLRPVRFRTNYRKHSIKHSGPMTWSNLPWEILLEMNVGSIKNSSLLDYVYLSNTCSKFDYSTVYSHNSPPAGC